MKILIIGDGNSIHLYNFIKVVLSDFEKNEITLFDMSIKNSNVEAYNFYTKNRVKVILNNSFLDLVGSNLMKDIPKIRSGIYKRKLHNRVKKLGDFDYCLLHFVDSLKSYLVYKHKKQFKRIIPIFWGSDLLRNPNLETKEYERLFKISYKIIFNTENMKREFSSFYGSRFTGKSEVIKFPTLSFNKIDELENQMSFNDIRTQLNLPLDKYVVVCGHAGSMADQHEQLVEAISHCDESVLDKCHFVFPMTYGEDNLIEYREQISKLMKKKEIKGEILRDYLVNKEMLKYMISADVHINVSKTDAFSGIMQENLYSGSFVIYGKWLNYLEIENSGIIAYPIKKISDVSRELDKLIMEFNELKQELKKNRKLISNISSPDIIKTLWKNKVFINSIDEKSLERVINK